MDYRICPILAKQAENFKEFMNPALADPRKMAGYAYYIAITPENGFLGMLVADPKKVDPEILSVAVSPRYEGRGIATDLVHFAVENILGLFPEEDLDVPNRFLVEAPLDEKNGKALTRVLEKNGFQMENGGYYRVPVGDLKKNKFLHEKSVEEKIKEEKASGTLVSLADLPRTTLKEFIAEVSLKQDLIPGLIVDELDEDLSYFELSPAGEVTACILFCKENQKVIRNLWLYQSPKNGLAGSSLMMVLSAAATAASYKYMDNVELSFLTSNDTSDKLLKKIFPDAKSDGVFLFAELDFEDALREIGKARLYSQPGFCPVENASLVCTHCKYRRSNVLECDKYLQKPSGVLDGGECPYFED